MIIECNQDIVRQRTSHTFCLSFVCDDRIFLVTNSIDETIASILRKMVWPREFKLRIADSAYIMLNSFFSLTEQIIELKN